MPSPVPGAYAPVAAADHAAYRSRRALRVPSAHARRLPEGRLPARRRHSLAVAIDSSAVVISECPGPSR
jgi:hypothetical protein